MTRTIVAGHDDAVKPPPLPYGRQTIEQDDIDAVVRQLSSPWLTQGPTIAKFEEAIAEAVGTKYAVAVANGTAALHLACLAAGVRAADVGLTADITFVASANAIRYAGGEPRLVDVDPETGLISTAALRERVAELKTEGKKPRVIIPVDFSGSVADLPGVRQCASEVGAIVIEDAAHALGARYTVGGESFPAACGHHADMAILSFHPVKQITTGEGGAVCTQNEALYRELVELRTHGITKDPAALRANDGPWYYEQTRLGFNYRMTDIQCALGIQQLKKLGRFVDRRRELAKLYDQAFAAAGLREHIRPLVVPSHVESARHLYVIRINERPGDTVDDIMAQRKALFLHLREASIFTQVHYIPVHRQPDFIDHGYAHGLFPGATTYYAGCLSLPLFPAMSQSDVDRVVDALAAFFRSTVGKKK